MKKKKKIIENIIFWLIVIGLVGVVVYCGIQVVPWLINDMQSQHAVHEVREKVHEHAVVEDNKFKFTKEAWDDLYAMNPDFLAYMAYDDEFISEPIVQGTDNDFYLNHWIDGSWDENGTFFFDCTSDMDDTNLTIYGHHIFYTVDARKMTPLVSLLEQEEYEAHPEFNVWYKDRKARYVITNIYYWDAVADQNFPFTQSNFDNEEDFREYADFINSRNMIEPNDTLEYGDRFLSLQTCKDLYGSTRIIFRCKEISSENYN